MIFESIFYSIKDKQILNGCNIELHHGQVHAFIGENGSGKSTLIKVGAGLITPDSGYIQIYDEKYFTKNNKKRFNYISYLPQKSFLNKNLKIQTYLNHFDEKLFQDKTIRKYSEKRIKHLSTGIRRYYEVMMLLSLDRDYYLLDEPFSGIEPILIEKICCKIISKKLDGTSFLIVDHYHRYIQDIADSYIKIHEGSILH